MIIKINNYSKNIGQLEGFLNSNIHADQNSDDNSININWIHEANSIKFNIDQKENFNLDF